MKRQIFLHTKTTGFSPKLGDRLTEIACLETFNGNLTDKSYHVYLNSGCEVSAKKAKMTGTSTFLQEKSNFKDIVEEFIAFIQGAEIFIHNALFNLRFINHELALIKYPCVNLETISTVVDTVSLARKKFPNEDNKLNGLCTRFNINIEHRKFHGALLDAYLLTEVYFKLIQFEDAPRLSKKTSLTPNSVSLNAIETPLAPVIFHQYKDESKTKNKDLPSENISKSLTAKRQIFLDTETTGFSPKLGHRLTEIGCLEAVGGKLTDKSYHVYLNPGCEVSAKATEITGLTLNFLKDKSNFKDVVEEFIAFIKGAEIFIHNAPFDLRFINHELALIKHPCLNLETVSTVVDTLSLARKKFPNEDNKLNRLCTRFNINIEHRKFHGALLDAHLLAAVYFKLIQFEDAPRPSKKTSLTPNSVSVNTIKTPPASLIFHQYKYESKTKNKDRPSENISKSLTENMKKLALN